MNRNVKFLLGRFLPFCAPLVAIAWGVEKRLDRLPNPFVEVRDRFEVGLESNEVALAGTSHLYKLPVREFARPTGTLAIPAQSLVTSAQLLEKYAPRMPRLQTVILEVSYFGFDYLIENTPSSVANLFYSNVFGIRGDGGLKQLLDVRNYSRFALYGNASSIFFLRNPDRPNPSVDNPFMSWWQASHEPMSDSVAEKRVTCQHAISRADARPRIVGKMESLLSSLKARGLRVVLLQTPVTEFYRRHLDPARLASATSEANRLASRHGARFLDYLSDARFIEADFEDTDHLAPGGAKKLVDILNREALEASPALPLAESMSAPRSPATNAAGRKE